MNTAKGFFLSLPLALAVSTAQTIPLNQYETGFENGIDTVWSCSSISSDNIYDGTGLTNYLGNFSRDPATQSDEWWGIDNIVVSIDAITSTDKTKSAEQSTIVLFALGLFGLCTVRYLQI